MHFLREIHELCFGLPIKHHYEHITFISEISLLKIWCEACSIDRHIMSYSLQHSLFSFAR